MTLAIVKWRAKFERWDDFTAKIDPELYALWAEGQGLSKELEGARPMDVAAYCREYTEVQTTIKVGETEHDEYAKSSVVVELFPNDEFHEKQLSLAVFLFNMNNGPVASVTEWLDQWGDTDYYSNYMADAEEILKSQPHLLSLPTREQMGLWDGPQPALGADSQA